MELPPGQPLVTMYRTKIRVVYSCQYKCVKNVSFTIAYLDKNNSQKFALIKSFVFIHQKVIAALKPLLYHYMFVAVHFSLGTSFIDTMSFLNSVSIADTYSFCFAEDIIIKYLFIDFSNFQYIVIFPSFISFD